MLIGLQCAVRALSYGSRKPRTSDAMTTIQKAKIALLANDNTMVNFTPYPYDSKEIRDNKASLLQEIAELAETNQSAFARRVLNLRSVGSKTLRSLQYAIFEFEAEGKSLEARIKALEDKLSGT